MFIKLLKRVLPKLSDKTTPNLFYFEETRRAAQADDDDEPLKKTKPQQEFMPVFKRHQLDFYHCLFGQSESKQQDELSMHVASKVALLLNKPNLLLKNLPVLPASVSQVLESMSDPDFDVSAIVQIIDYEPAIAAKVIELANSSYYKRGEKDVTDLHQAFMTLGSKGLFEGVINGFISQMTPQSKLYFKQYGNKIWHHSFSTGVIAKLLLEQSEYQEQAATAYLVGLLCNLGDMIIFQLMADAFSVVHPDCQPDSLAFKQLMMNHSKMLTCQMAKHWHFPESVVKALVVQSRLTEPKQFATAFEKYPMACYVFEANLLSELEIRIGIEPLNAVQLLKSADELIFSEQGKTYLAGLSAQ